LRLYHRINLKFLWCVLVITLSLVIGGCIAPLGTEGFITVSVASDNNEILIKIPSGSTAEEALAAAKILLGEVDKVVPPGSTVLSDGERVVVTRVKDEYYVEQITIPFEHQELKNEAFPEGERRLSQPGVNGIEEITYHRVFEDGVEVSNALVKTVVIKEAIPEIVMIGSKSTFGSVSIPGKIAYLSAGNAWIIENSTGDRNCVISSGDLDGRIFSLSRDGGFLLFTRYSLDKEKVNSLWVASLSSNPVRIIDLHVDNIVHYAEFDSGSTVVAYSTVEWRETAPGWQADNDLYEVSMSRSGFVGTPKMDLDSNSGGMYGWWGTEYSWAPDRELFLYSRPDSVGIFNKIDGSLTQLLGITPYQTGGDWAWVPGASWSPSGNVVYTVSNGISLTNSENGTQQFNLVAIPVTGTTPIDLVMNVGMFAYPVTSPFIVRSSINESGVGNPFPQNTFSLAYLQAIFPDQSESSGYRLFVADRDGSNKRSLFPADGAVGLEPQRVVWSPTEMESSEEFAVALIYNGNVWIINAITGSAQQITGDGLTNRVDWR
jgi:hypothetical protein